MPLPDDALPMRERCRAWLRRLAAGPKTKSKSAYYQDAERDLPGLSNAMFDSEWKLIMPPHWQRAGRPPKSES